MTDHARGGLAAALEVLSGSTILITGGCGMIGSRLATRLSDIASISVIDDLSSGPADELPADVRLVRGSILEPFSLRTAMTPRPDYVFHLAALFANQNSVEHPEQDLMVNGLGTLRVIDTAIAAGVRSLVYASSSCVYGSRSGALSEEHAPGDLHTPYAISKYLGEQYLSYFASTTPDSATRLSAVRYFNVYGPGEMPGQYRNVIPNFFARAARGEPLTITGDGTETRDFTFVDDAVEGTLLTAAFGHHGSVYNLGTGTETRIRELASAIVECTGSTASIEYTPRRSWDSTSTRRSDSSRAATDLGFAPTTELTSGLAQTYAWLQPRLGTG
jgi:UDP-glucose 4-epimerase